MLLISLYRFIVSEVDVSFSSGKAGLSLYINSTNEPVAFFGDSVHAAPRSAPQGFVAKQTKRKHH